VSAAIESDETLERILTDESDGQFANAEGPRDLTLVGMIILVKPVL